MNSSEEHFLPLGENLLWFKLIKVLGQGGFGITYLAEDLNLKKVVAIKEYFPARFASRNDQLEVKPYSDKETLYATYRQRFWEEAQTLASFSHPNIVRVRTAFEHHNTVYMVMDYERGALLQHYLQHQSLSEDKLIALMMPVFDGLAKVHQRGFIHRDIKPENIIVRENGTPVLLDFGSARPSAPHVDFQDVTVMVSPGYAPIEQFSDRLELQGPWTDIYALAAVMYFCITGAPPVDSQQRYIPGQPYKKSVDVYKSLLSLKPSGYHFKTLKAIDSALAFQSKARPQTMEQWGAKFELSDEVDIANSASPDLAVKSFPVVPGVVPTVDPPQTYHPLVLSNTTLNPKAKREGASKIFSSISMSLGVLGMVILSTVVVMREKKQEANKGVTLSQQAEPLNPNPLSSSQALPTQAPFQNPSLSPEDFYGPQSYELSRQEVAALVKRFKSAFEQLKTDEILSMTVMTWDKHMLLSELTKSYRQTSLRWGDFHINHNLTEGYVEFVIVKLVDSSGSVITVSPSSEWAKVRLVVRKLGEGQLIAKW